MPPRPLEPPCDAAPVCWGSVREQRSILGRGPYVQSGASLWRLPRRACPRWAWRGVPSLHIGDLEAIVAFQTALLRPALGVIVSTVFILKRAVVVVKIGVFAAEAPSYLPQGELRREK